MRRLNLNFIGRDLIIGLITASFIYAPDAFARPNNSAKKKGVSYSQLQKMLKKPGSKKMSEIADAVKPMLKKREYKLFLKDSMRAWDTKFTSMAVGRNYFKFKAGGKTYFGRYVDRGPTAFILNNKPILWKDVLFYSTYRARIHQIVTGKKLRKVSMLENLFNYLSGEAYGLDDDDTVITEKPGGEDKPPAGDDGGVPIVPRDGSDQVVPVPVDASGGRTICITLNEMNRWNSQKGSLKAIKCRRRDKASCSPINSSGLGVNVICSKNPHRTDCATMETSGGGLVDEDCKPGECENSPVTQKLNACDGPVEPPKPKGKMNWAIIAVIAALFLFLLLRKKNKGSNPVPPTPPNPPEPPQPPTPPYTPGGESTCPPVGSRGITQEERDKLPGCNKSSCVANGTCVDGASGETVD